MPIYTEEQLIQRAFLRVARNIRDIYEENRNSDTRLFIEPFIPNRFVIVGQSKAGREHMEHVVPCLVIRDKCHEMFDKHESVEAVAVFIRKFLKVVWISKAEQAKLDKGCNLNLRQRMPDGWTFENGDVFERLRLADIDFDLIPDDAHTWL
jgi:hypothetical protein